MERVSVTASSASVLLSFASYCLGDFRRSNRHKAVLSSSGPLPHGDLVACTPFFFSSRMRSLPYQSLSRASYYSHCRRRCNLKVWNRQTQFMISGPVAAAASCKDLGTMFPRCKERAVSGECALANLCQGWYPNLSTRRYRVFGGQMCYAFRFQVHYKNLPREAMSSFRVKSATGRNDVLPISG
jgi:hypothetical protein